MIQTFDISIPTYENGKWSVTEYDNIEDFGDFIFSTFKEPGEYDFDETSFLFNEHARYFEEHKVYSYAMYNSKDFIKYWDGEKQKCVNGVIFKSNDKVWYLPREYYMWLNFLKIYDKVRKKFDFPIVMDVQLHMALYELLAELNYVHAAIFKKRQIASSYYHMAKFINRIWFDEGVILKMGASLKDYVNLAGSWKFLDEYKTFLNSHTAWYRPMNPSKVLEWQQKIEIRQDGRTRDVGLKGMIQGMSFEQSPTKGVGGPCSLFFYEEAGIAPTMDKTAVYMKSAMEMGDLVTGTFIAAGSVGELKDAEPLKEMILNPKPNKIYAVKSDLLDDKGTLGLTGLFIPEQWGMAPYIDQYGNSLVEEALKALDVRFAKAQKEMSAELYQLEVSQHPRNIKEGFAHREESKFPVALIERNLRDIEECYYP
jgi:hypothetical protein